MNEASISHDSGAAARGTSGRSREVQAGERNRTRACQPIAHLLSETNRELRGESRALRDQTYWLRAERHSGRRQSDGNVGAGAQIHPDACVHPDARIGANAEIGARSVIAEGAVIGAGTRLHARVLIGPNVVLGRGCVVHPGALITGGVVAGDDNHIHECVTIQGAADLRPGDGAIHIGNGNRIMAYCHVGPGCRIGSGVTIANLVWLPHQVEVQDQVMIGGLCLISPFVHIGRLAMVGFLSDVAVSVPPFTMAEGIPCDVLGLNVVGLRRVGMSAAARTALKRCYKLLYRSGLSAFEAAERIETDVDASPERDELLRFVRNRPLLPAR
jgi:UDP-N-acetylglucosamine acyltransferase